jgi:hypothetical protein
MYPTIRPGDILHIQSRAVVDVSVGDIAVSRRQGVLFAHRVISKGTEEGRACVVTRPDRAEAGNDAPTFDEGLLGMVVAIERRGRRMPLHPSTDSWPVRGILSLRLALTEALSSALPRLAQMLEKIQATALYRLMASSWPTLVRPCISYRVRLPMPTMGGAVYRELAPEGLDLQADWKGRPVTRWTLTLHLNGRRQAAAWATFARDSVTGWRMIESFESARYRGTGLDEMLFRQAMAILDRER